MADLCFKLIGGLIILVMIAFLAKIAGIVGIVLCIIILLILFSSMKTTGKPWYKR